ncbi:glycosyl transferase [Dulcicalothrix desertica PCC 7102]|uniref:Glycosyl transferase n=1 Tax=Dulcicalothrix desertica PCC 7102 TaxID=232991 RepID=A0A433VU77_9CYAN|nr:glycosyltransferase [Dulcicalothrix desertica]RUT09680.1 glycosyl transferase [Dulcicalothrix desertica PCC 7102]TWH50876.1 glycosyltransferase involved in cell wall biosynthesis [Dulcicalothrix desertica PCC 7102]
MNLSVIVPCFNAADTIAFQLEALAKQQCSLPWEIIVVDNGSTDDTVAIIKQYQHRLPHLRFVETSAIQCAAHARNVGASVAYSEALAFCDADDEVAACWVAAMIEALSKYDFVAGYNDYWKLNQPWVIECCKYREGNGVNKHPYLPYAGASNLGVKRSVHEMVSGFDEKMLVLEDVDYCWRIQEAGKTLNSATNALVHFRFRNTIGDLYHRYRKLAVYDVLLNKQHQKVGMPKLIKWQSFVKDAAILPVKFLLKVHNREKLVRWLLDVAWFTGHLQGCIKYKYLP